MSDGSKSDAVVISQTTKDAFLGHIREHPSNHRVSAAEREALIEWLTNPNKRPTSQREFSRRNYARKTFFWDEHAQNLIANKAKPGGTGRPVITEDTIADVVEAVHIHNGHAGWDTTWRDVSMSYYGILRADVIYLLKNCQICADNPRKRPKGYVINSTDDRTIDQDACHLNFDDLFPSEEIGSPLYSVGLAEEASKSNSRDDVEARNS